MHLRRYVLALLVVLCSQSPLGAQDTDADGQFYLDLAGSAVFPYDPAGPSGPGDEGIPFDAVLLRKSKLAPSAPTRRFVTDRSRTTLVDQARSFD